MKTLIVLLSLLVVGLACSPDPAITNDMLDSGTFFDPSLYNPDRYLISKAIPTPTAEQARRPVIIACHGYSASTFEWDEFRSWANRRTDFYLSQVLLGGHGRSYEDFKKSTWHDWQSAIITEYEQLVKAGYQNISLLGSSTSGALLTELVASGYFNGRLSPRNIFLVDPIIIPSDKSLSLIGVFGPMLGYIDTKQPAAEDKYYYHFRPQETLQQLETVLNVARKDLEKGVTLPTGCSMKIYKSKKDSAADPVSAVLIYRGTKTATGQLIDVDMIDSDLHVYTRLKLRDQVSPKDEKNQTTTFTDIVARVLR
jgi:carboxylesterase